MVQHLVLFQIKMCSSWAWFFHLNFHSLTVCVCFFGANIYGENACNSVSIDVAELLVWLSMFFTPSLLFYSFVYKQTIFTRKSKTHEMQHTCPTDSFEWNFSLFHQFRYTFSYKISKGKKTKMNGEKIIKHFDQLNSKCECHWIWHRWMILVEIETNQAETGRDRMKEKKKLIMTTYRDNTHAHKNWNFFHSHSVHIILVRCIDESERIVRIVWLAHRHSLGQWWHKKKLQFFLPFGVTVVVVTFFI